MRRLDPTAKFFALLALTFEVAIQHNALFNLILVLLCLVALLISRVNLKTLGLLLIPSLMAALGMFFTGYRFSAGSNMPVRDSILAVGTSPLINGITLASHVLAYAGLGFVFTLTTDRVQLIRSARYHLHIPQVFAYGLLAAWGIFPRMSLEYRRARAAFRARGIRTFPVSPALLKPLLVKSVRWSESLSVAMESRGFSGQAERTEYGYSRFGAGDWAFVAVCCLIVPAALAVL